MKKFLILAIILTSSSAYAACSIDGSSTSCSIAEFQIQQPMQQTYTQNSIVKEFADTPETRLNPAQNNAPSRNLRNFGPQPADYNYNTSCQFGVCNNSGTPQLFEQRR